MVRLLNSRRSPWYLSIRDSLSKQATNIIFPVSRVTGHVPVPGLQVSDNGVNQDLTAEFVTFRIVSGLPTIRPEPHLSLPTTHPLDYEKGMSGHPTWRFDLMLKNGEFSALVQCDDWIHLAGAPRGKIARKQCDCQEHKRRSDEAGRIACANAVEELRQS